MGAVISKRTHRITINTERMCTFENILSQILMFQFKLLILRVYMLRPQSIAFYVREDCERNWYDFQLYAVNVQPKKIRFLYRTYPEEVFLLFPHQSSGEVSVHYSDRDAPTSSITYSAWVWNSRSGWRCDLERQVFAPRTWCM